LAAASAFALLSLAAELVGRSLTHRIDVGKHVAAPSYANADYYPFLLLAVKLGIALLLARLVWRFLRARATARAGRAMLARVGASERWSRPPLRLGASARLWTAAFVVTAAVYVVQADAEQISSGHWALLAPLLHTSALSVFAVLSVAVALLWAAIAGWLTSYERYARRTIASARRLVAPYLGLPAPPRSEHVPRPVFGDSFGSRPPPLPA
jgi:hypothetical protein